MWVDNKMARKHDITIDVKTVAGLKTVTIDKNTVWRDKKYVSMILGIMARDMGRVIRDGILFPNAVKHPVTNTWVIPDDDVHNAMLIQSAQRVANVEASYETTTRMRPTTASCKRIRIRVNADKTLTQQQRDVFTSRINAYELEWDTAYARRGNDDDDV